MHASVDTLKFDTVFVSAGSVTKSFKIFNDNNQKLRISKIKLAPAGNATPYKMNVDGTAASEVDNIDVAANDSIYVFVQVNVDPTLATNPFIISDSILISYNGNNQYVQLQAYGQNANFINCGKIEGNVVWNSPLPYVILGCGIQVDTTATLTIQKGVRVYVHATSPFIVDGTLIVTGTVQDSVVFRGDRLDPDYRDLPAGWPGIIFRNTSHDNSLRFATIRNAYQGIVVLNNNTPKLQLSQCIIDNAYDAGIYGINGNIQADNSLISNCGKNLLLLFGGTYQFYNCTAASYSNFFIEHKYPALEISDNDGSGNTNPLTATFTNCIFWGDNDVLVPDEVVVSKQGSTFNLTFDHALYKGADPANSTFTVPVIHQDPMFDNIDVSRNIYNFRLQTSSPAIDMGAPLLPMFLNDLDDFTRIYIPDLGCYEFH